MFWTFFATAALAVIAVLWRLWPTPDYSLKDVTLRGMDAVMVALLSISLDLLVQAMGLETTFLLKVAIYLMGAASLLAFAWFIVTAWLAVLRWYRRRNEGGQHFDFG